MTRVAAIGVLACLLGSLVHAQDVLSQLGITPLAARVAVETVLTRGLNNPGLPAKAFNLLPGPARAGIATAGMAWLRTYTASPEFKQQYARIRQDHKPPPPRFEGTPEDELKQADEEQRQQAADSKKAIAALPADQRAQIEEALKAAQAMTAQMNTPEMRKTRLDGIKADRAVRMKEHEADVAAWSRDYPEDPSAAIARRLREFLEISAEVDFAAPLTSRNGKMVFADDQFEQKLPQWKMCYRAGKEATAAARAAAQAWLRELGL